MAKYKQLIRLKKWNLDVARRELIELEGLREEMHAKIENLEQSLVQEQMLAAKSGLLSNYGDFAKAAMERRQRLQQSMSELEKQISAKTDEIQDAFKELKTVEIAAARAAEREAYKRRRIDQMNLDDMAGQRAFRSAS